MVRALWVAEGRAFQGREEQRPRPEAGVFPLLEERTEGWSEPGRG